MAHHKLDAVPLLDPTPQEQSASPQYPQKSIQIVAQGLLVQDVFSPFFVVSTIIPADNMDEIVKAWREFRKQQRLQMDTIAAVQRTRND